MSGSLPGAQGPGHPRLVPDRGPGLRHPRLLPDTGACPHPGPKVGAQDPAPAPAEHPSRHRPPRPTHRAALQGPPPPSPASLSPGSGTRGPYQPHRHAAPSHTRPTTLKEEPLRPPGQARPPRPDTRQAVTPTCHNQTHHTGNDATPAPPNHPMKDRGQCHEADAKQQVAGTRQPAAPAHVCPHLRHGCGGEEPGHLPQRPPASER